MHRHNDNIGGCYVIYVVLTREVVELMERLHDDGDEWQVELSDVGSDLRVGVTGVCIMAAQQGVNSTNGLFMKEKHPVGKKREYQPICWFLAVSSTVFHFKVHTLLIPKGELNETPDSYIV